MKRKNEILAIGNSLEQIKTNKRPKQSLGQHEMGHCVNEAQKNLNMALQLKTLSERYVEDVRNFLDDIKRELNNATRKHCNDVKHHSEAEDHIKVLDKMIANTIPVLGNISEQNAVDKKPKQHLAQREMVRFVNEAHKTLNTTLQIKTLSKQYVDTMKNLFDDVKREFETAKQKVCDIIKYHREAEDQIKQSKKMAAKAELHKPERWKIMYRKLEEYKEKHGNCMVPHRSRTDLELDRLGRWVGNQRVSYKYYKNGKRSYITAQRIDELEKIGFVWSLKEYRWQVMYEHLVAYHKKKGNCFVPCKYDSNQELANWCRTQREQWHRYQKGLTNTLSADRIEALSVIGFISNIKNKNMFDK
mmetsp:Transcript_13826/g.20174  ORF Transcript_13826/g.20174 Transcript_13826/m.20174 type:complete len:359 (-) Transcript_13826:97-1173(-)